MMQPEVLLDASLAVIPLLASGEVCFVVESWRVEEAVDPCYELKFQLESYCNLWTWGEVASTAGHLALGQSPAPNHAVEPDLQTPKMWRKVSVSEVRRGPCILGQVNWPARGLHGNLQPVLLAHYRRISLFLTIGWVAETLA